ncbi:MAG: ABC-type transport auxiliary lipoprotein family protein [Syntrophales bacterium]|jgi:ABC-type uncharacterized transport system auxiliary subunit|nr:ABC-type transport auxiliary lipoprotein family protein [Syntrophales bacterium]MCK9527903.1 ABC-type transport auxiliary lipoprotein family protein [Syntrophales bacterium]MDX9921922.1 ABC-type transport auxiliary lipoprotein family protein [Syntrophales bacterium]
MRKNFFRAAIPAVMAVTVLLVISGCAGGRTATPEIAGYVLEQPELGVSPSRGTPLTQDTVAVLRFTAAHHCRGNAMIYRSAPFRSAAYHYHRWKDSPADMVTEYVASTLLDAHMFKALFVDYAYEKSRYCLEGRLIDCHEEIDHGSRKAVLRFTATFLDTLPKSVPERVLFQNTYSREKIIAGDGPAGLVEAMNEVMAALAQQLVEDIRVVLKDETTQGRSACPDERTAAEPETD